MSELKMGCTAKDVVSGYQGIVVAISQQLNGNIRYSLECPCDGNKRDDGYDFDINMLDYVDEGLFSRVPELQTSDIELGTEVKDIISGFTGITTEKIWFLNGCLYYRVVANVATAKSEDGKPVQILCDHLNLKTTKQKAIEPKKPATDRAPGGPVTRAVRL